MLTVMIVDDETLGRRALRECCAGEPDLRVVGEYADGRMALAAARVSRPDVLFLDVEMDSIDGMTLADELGACRAPMIVFVTAHGQYAARAFDLRAADYLLKPFDAARFQVMVERLRWRQEAEQAAIRQEALERAVERIERTHRTRTPVRHRVLVGVGTQQQMLDAEQIEAVSAERNYVWASVGAQRHPIRTTLREAERTLRNQPLLRVSRSCLVNLNHVREVTRTRRGDYILVLHGGTTVTSAEGYRESVRRQLARLQVGRY